MRDLANKPYYGVIKQYTHWIVLFREKQVTLGSVIIMAKDSEAISLGSLTSEAWSEFGVVCKDVEQWLSLAFGAEKFNYLGLMMVDPEVHFHVIPRYSQPVEFAGTTFTDSDWPSATKRIPLQLDEVTLSAIKDKLIKTASS